RRPAGAGSRRVAGSELDGDHCEVVPQPSTETLPFWAARRTTIIDTHVVMDMTSPSLFAGVFPRSAIYRHVSRRSPGDSGATVADGLGMLSRCPGCVVAETAEHEMSAVLTIAS
ncbi:MAG: hypothetical protein WBQ66_08090, partial [Blastocatellia bacterium]